VKLVEDNLLGKTYVRSIWQVATSSNQVLQHYAFNESAKPSGVSNRVVINVTPAKGHTAQIYTFKYRYPS